MLTIFLQCRDKGMLAFIGIVHNVQFKFTAVCELIKILF